jgi:hypothetical protein
VSDIYLQISVKGLAPLPGSSSYFLQCTLRRVCRPKACADYHKLGRVSGSIITLRKIQVKTAALPSLTLTSWSNLRYLRWMRVHVGAWSLTEVTRWNHFLDVEFRDHRPAKASVGPLLPGTREQRNLRRYLSAAQKVQRRQSKLYAPFSSF